MCVRLLLSQRDIVPSLPLLMIRQYAATACGTRTDASLLRPDFGEHAARYRSTPDACGLYSIGGPNTTRRRTRLQNSEATCYQENNETFSIFLLFIIYSRLLSTSYIRRQGTIVFRALSPVVSFLNCLLFIVSGAWASRRERSFVVVSFTYIHGARTLVM